MPAAPSRLANRVASLATWLMISAVIAGAGAVLALAPVETDEPEPGDIVAYSEDLVGRPWRVLEEVEFGRYEIRNGRVVAIADASELSEYRGPSKSATIQMAGLHRKTTLVAVQAD